MCCFSCFFARVRQKLPKVNKELALKLIEEGDDEADLALRKKKGKVRKSSGSLCFRPKPAHQLENNTQVVIFFSSPTPAGPAQHPGRRPVQGDVREPRLSGGRAERGVPPPQPHRLQGGTEEEEEAASAGSAGRRGPTGDTLITPTPENQFREQANAKFRS